MISKREFYKWREINLIEGKKYMNIEFITAFYFFGIPIFKYCKHIPNREHEEMELPDNGAMINNNVYIPSRDEAKIMMGQVDNNFE